MTVIKLNGLNLHAQIAAIQRALQDVIDISNIDVPDELVAALIKGTAGAGEETRGALGGRYVATVTPEAHGTVDGIDDTAAFQAAVDASAAFGLEVLVGRGRSYVLDTVGLLPGTRIRVDGTLTKKAGTQGALFSGTAVEGVRITGEGTIDGNKANQTAYTAGVGLLDFATCDDLLIEGITVTGHYLPLAETSGNTTASVYVRNSSRARVRDVTVTDYAREAIWLEDCEDSSIIDASCYGGIDSWSGFQCSGTRNLVANCRSIDAGASGMSVDSTYSLVIGCLVKNNRYFSGFNFGHDGIPADYTVVSGCTYHLDAGVNLTAVAGQANGFNAGNGSVEVGFVGCVSIGALGHGFNVSSGAKNARFTNCRATGSGLAGLNFFSAAAGDYISGSDLDLAGNTGGSFLSGGTSPAFDLFNVRISPTSVLAVVTTTADISANVTARGNIYVIPSTSTDYRELGVQRVSGGNTYKIAMGGSGTAGVLLAARDGTTFATLTFSYNGGAPVLTSNVPIKPPSYTTAGRPSAVSVGAGAMVYDTTLGKPVWSNGSVWKDAAGTTV